MPAAGTTTKSDERRRLVIDAAVSCFARKGFYGTTTHEIAQQAGISQPYVYRLFPDKQSLFVQTVAHVSDLLKEALSAPAATVTAETRDGAGQVLREAYGALIKDRDVMRFLMQANCVDEPVIRDAVRACYAVQVSTVSARLGGNQQAVRDWFAAGMLDNVVASLGLAELHDEWARTLSGV
jgi:AcrR family transcriptional regulator